MLQVFPSNLVGLKWDVTKAPMSSTSLKTARNGKEYRAANWSYNKYKWQLSYSCLRQNRYGLTELQELFGFCLQMQGQFQSFLYTDPTDNTVVNQGLGAGNGSQIVYPLLRTFGGWTDPNLVLNAMQGVYINGILTTAYTLIEAGQYGIDSVQFNVAPAIGALITATFSYYFPVRFLEDSQEFNNFAYQFWELKKLAFQSVK